MSWNDCGLPQRWVTKSASEQLHLCCPHEFQLEGFSTIEDVGHHHGSINLNIINIVTISRRQALPRCKMPLGETSNSGTSALLAVSAGALPHGYILELPKHPGAPIIATPSSVVSGGKFEISSNDISKEQRPSLLINAVHMPLMRTKTGWPSSISRSSSQTILSPEMVEEARRCGQ